MFESAESLNTDTVDTAPGDALYGQDITVSGLTAPSGICNPCYDVFHPCLHLLTCRILPVSKLHASHPASRRAHQLAEEQFSCVAASQTNTVETVGVGLGFYPVGPRCSGKDFK